MATSMTFGAPIPLQTGPAGCRRWSRHTASCRPSSSRSTSASSTRRSAPAMSRRRTSRRPTASSRTRATRCSATQHILGIGNVVPVVSDGAINAEGPVFVSTIDDIDALLTTAEMRRLNAEVDLDLETPTTVARNFLAERPPVLIARALLCPGEPRSSRSHRSRAACWTVPPPRRPPARARRRAPAVRSCRPARSCAGVERRCSAPARAIHPGSRHRSGRGR